MNPDALADIVEGLESSSYKSMVSGTVALLNLGMAGAPVLDQLLARLALFTDDELDRDAAARCGVGLGIAAVANLLCLDASNCTAHHLCPEVRDRALQRVIGYVSARRYELVHAAIYWLGNIGSAAACAIPDLLHAAEISLERAARGDTSESGRFIGARAYEAIRRIAPDQLHRVPPGVKDEYIVWCLYNAMGGSCGIVPGKVSEWLERASDAITTRDEVDAD